jgi:hypothetical protein
MGKIKINRYELKRDGVILYLDADSALELLFTIDEKHRALESCSLGNYAIRLVGNFLFLALPNNVQQSDVITLLTKDKWNNSVFVIVKNATVQIINMGDSNNLLDDIKHKTCSIAKLINAIGGEL